MNKYFLFAFLLVGALFSCTEGELITPGDEYLIPTEPGTFEVKMNGVLKDFSYTANAAIGEGGSFISGMSETGSSISIVHDDIFTEGVFLANPTFIISIINSDGLFSNVTEAGVLPLNMTITSINFVDFTITGTFSGAVYNQMLEEEAVLTDGKFYKIPFEMDESANRVLSAYFNDQPLDFSTNAYASGQTTSAIITGINTEQIQTMTISVPGGLADDAIFTEEDGVVIQISLDASPNPNDYYTNYDALTETYLPFTLTIESVTPGESGRVVGTFSGKISKFVSGQPGEEIEITNGLIDVPVQ